MWNALAGDWGDRGLGRRSLVVLERSQGGLGWGEGVDLKGRPVEIGNCAIKLGLNR